MAKKKKLSSNLVNSILYIVVGALFCFCNDSILDTILKIAGIVFIALGVVDLIKEQWMSGVGSIVIGAVVLICAWQFIEIVLLIMGVLLAIKGFIALMEALKNKSFIGFLFSGLTVAAGVMLAINAKDLISWLFIVVGIVLVVDGLIGLLECVKGKK